MYAMKSCVPIIWCLSSLNKLFTLLQSSKTLKSFSAAPQPISLYPVLAQEIISSHVQDFTFVLDVFHKVPDSPFLQSVWLSPDGNPALENREYNQCQQPQREYTQYLSCRCYPKCVKLFQKKKKKRRMTYDADDQFILWNAPMLLNDSQRDKHSSICLWLHWKRICKTFASYLSSWKVC